MGRKKNRSWSARSFSSYISYEHVGCPVMEALLNSGPFASRWAKLFSIFFLSSGWAFVHDRSVHDCSMSFFKADKPLRLLSPPPSPPCTNLTYLTGPTHPHPQTLSQLLCPAQVIVSYQWSEEKEKARHPYTLFFFLSPLSVFVSEVFFFFFFLFLSNELYLLWKKKNESIGSLLHHCTALRSLAPAAAAEARKKGGLRSGAQLCCSVLDSIGGAESYSVSVSWVGSPANVQGFDNVPAPQSQKNLQGEREGSGAE